MRVLVVSPDAPAPHHVNGGATRQFQLLRRLLERGDEVTIAAAFAPTDQPHDETLRAMGFEVVASHRPRSRLREVFAAFIRRPALLASVPRVSLKELIARIVWVDLRPRAQALLREREFDAILVESEGARAWIDDLDCDAVKILTVYEVESAQLLEKAERRRGLNRILRRHDGRCALAGERRYIPRYDAVITMSEIESARIAAAVPGHPPLHVVGNGADRSAFAIEMPTPGHQRVLFAGTMVFPPNRVAATWLAKTVWPQVREVLPGASLEIVGRSPSAQTRALGELPGVTVTADAPNMTPHLSAADVCAVPMTEGGGTRLKLAEAMAAGRAIVATSNGVRGVNVRHRSELLIADEPQEFAAAIVALLTDAELRERLGTAARAKAAAEYSWGRLGDGLHELLAELTGTAPRPAGDPLRVAEV